MMTNTKESPCFDNLLKVLRCEKPDRPVLFELFMNRPLYESYAGHSLENESPLAELRLKVEAFAKAGYDYATTHACAMSFKTVSHRQAKTISLNDKPTIYDRATFEAYSWPKPDDFDYSILEEIEKDMPRTMKLMVMGPGGVLENVVALTGYDNLCYMLFEDPDLVKDLFDAVGETLVKYYEKAIGFNSVGVLMSNDDWGFNKQTFLSTSDMRRYVFPWHKKIVAVAHNAGKPAILHSCGYVADVMEDIITDMKYDGKHSYEDKILPVEQCYELWGGRIAIMGGIDVDFLIRSSEADIQKRCLNMLQITKEKGGYALGSGNSIPEYIPLEKYAAMIETRKLL